MRIPKLLTGAIAAGALACSLVGAPFAMASSLLQGIADGIGTSAEATAAYTTVTVGNVTAQIPQDWEPFVSGRGGESVLQYSSEPGIVQIMSTTEQIAVGLEQELIDAFTQDFVGSVPDYVQTGQETYTLDGTLVQALTGTASRAEGELALVNMVFFIDDEFTAIVAAAYSIEDNPQFEQFAHVVRTLSVATAAPASQGSVDPGFVVGSNTPAPDGGTLEVTVEEEPAEVVETLVYTIDGWVIDFAEPYTATALEIDASYEDYLVGQTAICVPFTVTNAGENEAAPWMLWGAYFGPSGLQGENINYYFSDSIDGSDYLQPGESTVVNLYFLYEGDGTYSAYFEDYMNGFYCEYSFDYTLSEGTVDLERPLVSVGLMSTGGTSSGESVDETAALGETAYVGGWELTVSADAASYQAVTAPADDPFFEEYAGTQLVAVPVTVTNLTGTVADPFDIIATYYTPEGVEVDSWLGIAYDDSIENVGYMRDGATAQTYVYIPYTVDGTYTAHFVEYDELGTRYCITMGIDIAL